MQWASVSQSSRLRDPIGRGIVGAGVGLWGESHRGFVLNVSARGAVGLPKPRW